MQPSHILLAVAALCAIALPLTQPATTATASACTLRHVPDPWERLDGRLDYSMELVLVGTVQSEHLVNERSRENEYENEYESTIHVDAILRGSLPDDELVIPNLSSFYNCGTSPRLREGNRVLLVLRQLPLSANPQSPDDYYWEIGPTGGSIFFGISGALLKDYQSDTGDSYLGENEAVILYVAKKVGASQADTARAVAVVSGEKEDVSRLYFGVAILGLILAGAAVFAIRDKGGQRA